MTYFYYLKEEMVYGERTDGKIIADGECDGFYFVIVNRGAYPCAYIEITEDHPYYKRDDVELPVHCGVTFTGYLSSTTKDGELKKFENRFFIGWDYAHIGDYIGGSLFCDYMNDKKWTVKEIFEEDVVPAIHYLKGALK